MRYAGPSVPVGQFTEEEFQAFVMEQLRQIGTSLAAGVDTDFLLLKELHAVPAKLFEGMIVRADGTDWDPGDGPGIYVYRGGSWFLLEDIAYTPPTLTAVSLFSGSFPAGATQVLTNIPAGYRAYQLRIIGASCDTASRYLQVRISTDNGASYAATNYHGTVANGGAFNPTNTRISAAAQVQAAADVDSRLITFTGFEAGAYPHALTVGENVASDDYIGSHYYYGSTLAVNALEIGWNAAGNFDAGTYELRGLLR